MQGTSGKFWILMFSVVPGLLSGCVSQPSKPAQAAQANWESLFDGHTLAGWKATDFPGHGAVHCESGTVVLDKGTRLTGITWTNEPPKQNYEIELEARRVAGSDFFCGLTFPVGEAHCSLILGGWGGEIVGISSINTDDASDNQTTSLIQFDSGKWYHIRLRVTDEMIEAWLDERKIVNLETTGLKITMRPGEIELSQPLGLATWKTTGALRNIRLRRGIK
jgi:hypothetical protein